MENVKIKPLWEADRKYIEEVIEKRANENDWYVLKYDVKTSEYNNKIVCKPLKEAWEEFEATEPSYDNERIELIFSPNLFDEDYKENAVVNYKGITRV